MCPRDTSMIALLAVRISRDRRRRREFKVTHQPEVMKGLEFKLSLDLAHFLTTVTEPCWTSSKLTMP